MTTVMVCFISGLLGAALPGDATADGVLGQVDFASNAPNQPAGLPTAGNMFFLFAPGAVVAPDGRLYVADDGNHRVLGWPGAAALAHGEPADLVIGQSTFSSGDPNGGIFVPTDASFFLPQGLTVDAAGALWVSDAFNHRVLKFENPAQNDSVADVVLGQLDFFSADQNLGLGEAAATAGSLNYPGRVLAVEGGLFVADSGNSRVLYYAAPVLSQGAAVRVFGQFGDFTTPIKNNDGSGTCTNVGEDPCGPPSADNLFNPIGLAYDRAGSLYVADWINHRVLRYDAALTSDTTADVVYGQVVFDTGNPNDGGPRYGLNLPTDVAVDRFGRVYVADSNNHRVVVYPPIPAGAVSPAPLAVFGQLGDPTTTEINHGLGPAMTDADGLSGPSGLAVDADGSIHVVDAANSRTLRFDLPLPAPFAGDMDFDNDVDDGDVAGWVACMTGPQDGIVRSECLPADRDGDGDVDLDDARWLVQCYSGSGQTPGGSCP